MLRIMVLTILFLALVPSPVGSIQGSFDAFPEQIEKSDHSLAARLASERLAGLVRERLERKGDEEAASWRVRMRVSTEVRGIVSGKTMISGEPVPERAEAPQEVAPLPKRDPGNDRVVSLVSERCLDLAEAGIKAKFRTPAPLPLPRGGLLYCGDPGPPAA